MDDLAPGTIKVKHKLIPQVPFIVIGEETFDPEIHEKFGVDTSETVSSSPPVVPTTVLPVELNNDLPPNTIRVKHKLIPQVQFVVINDSDFDSEIHELFNDSDDNKSSSHETETSSTVKPDESTEENEATDHSETTDADGTGETSETDESGGTNETGETTDADDKPRSRGRRKASDE